MKKFFLLLALTANLPVLAQNVGIGTTNPTNTLHITPTGSVNPIRIDGLQNFSTEKNLLVVDPTNGVVKHIHIDSIINMVLDSIGMVGSDDQNIDSLTLNGTLLTAYIENGLSANIDLSTLQDGTGTDNQNIDSLTLNGTILTAYIENGLSANIDLSTLQDGTGTDNQNIDSLTLNGTILSTFIESGSSANIDLQPIIDSALANSSTPDTLEWEKGSIYGDNDTVIYARRAKNNSQNIRAYSNGDFDIDRHYLKDGIIILTNEPNNSSSGLNNLVVGHGSLTSITTGQENSSLGRNSLRNNTTGNYNTALGNNTLNSNTTGSSNTSVGFESLLNNNTGNENVAIGYQALRNNDNANGNTAVGVQSMYTNISGNNNTALGVLSLAYNTIGTNNTAIGYRALIFNTSGEYNTGSGAGSLYGNTTGSRNSSLGYYSMANNTSGSYNTASGYRAMYFNLSGQNNAANGYEALFGNRSGVENLANGYRALYSNYDGNGNVALGFEALYDNSNTSNNTAIGYRAFSGFYNDISNVINFAPAGINISTNNIYIPSHGYTVGETYRFIFTTTGSAPGGMSPSLIYHFTATHTDSLQLSGDITSIGSGTHSLTPNITRNITNSTSLGANSLPTKSNQVVLGDINVSEVLTSGSLIPYTDGIQNIGSASERWNTLFATNGTINTSDKRLKTNILKLQHGLSDILKLNPVSYNWVKNDNGTRIGFIAQELDEIIPEVVSKGNDKNQTLGVRYNEIIPVIVKAMQEQQEIIDKQQKEIENLKLEIEKMK